MRKSNRRKTTRKSLFRRNPKPLWLMILMHAALLGVALLLYVIPHHVMPSQQQIVGTVSQRTSAQATPEAAPVQPAQPEAAPVPVDDVGEFRIKFADKFTSGEVIQTENSYQSANVNVTFSTMRFKESNVNIADVYVADIECLVNAFGEEGYGRGSKYTDHPTEIANREGAVATLTGDYNGGRGDGVVIRNGMLYRDETISRDVCVLYWDGSMKCFAPEEFDTQTEIANGAYQAWNFGPMLLTRDGLNMEQFNSDVESSHPRAILGYYEPGHYALITVDGRSDESAGLRLEYCSILAYTLGLKQAYNLDGGESAALLKGGELFGVPYRGGREVYDVLMVMDKEAAQ